MQRNPQRTCAKQSNEEDRLLRKPLVSWIFSCGEHLAWWVFDALTGQFADKPTHGVKLRTG